MKLISEDVQNKSFNWELALKQLNQNSELAKNLLTVFCDELPLELEKIDKLFQDQDWHALRSIVHKLQGACVYCGVPLLREHLKSAEKILLDDFQPHELKLSLDVIKKEAEIALKEIKLFLVN